METNTRPLTLAEAMVEAMAKIEPIPELLLQSLKPVAEGEGEQILGTLPESLRRLWALLQELALTLKAKAETLKEEDGNPEKLESLIREKDRQEALNQVFWKSVRDIFGYKHETISIRQNYQVVAVPEPKEEKCDCPFCQMERHGGIAIPLAAILGLGMLGPHR